MAPSSGGQSAEASQLVSDFVQACLEEAQVLVDWSQDPNNTWKPEDVVDRFSTTTINLFPLYARGIDFTLGLLRPWAQAFQERTTGEAPSETTSA